MKLYLIRHGQSEGNLLKTHSGWSQIHLTEQGRLDAARAGRVLENIKFDKVYSSDLLRAVETQKIALPNAVAEAIPLLREINVGELSGRSFSECYEELGDEYANDRRLFEFSRYGGESYEEFCSRIREFLSLVEISGYETVAAFCHGGFINTMIDVITGLRTDRRQFACQNCSVSVFEYKDGKWTLKLWNYMGTV